jgi:hypothetical protein
MRWGAQLADVRTCLALRTCLAFKLWTCLAFAFADVACLAFAFADAACLAFALRTCREAVLKSLPPSQNLFLSILQLVF